jgi:hypothetical protein
MKLSMTCYNFSNRKGICMPINYKDKNDQINKKRIRLKYNCKTMRK